MSVKVISGIAGSVTTIGGGIGIYLFNNSKNDTNNPAPKLSDNLDKKIDQNKQIQHTNTRTWNEITESAEYKAAQTSGKLLEVISYKDEETAEGVDGRALVEVDWTTEILKQKIIEVKILWDSEQVAKASIEDETGEFYEDTFPLICFTNKKDDPKELNFNELKSCSMKTGEAELISSHKYLVVFLYEQANNPQHKFHEFHSKKPTLKIELIYENTSAKTSHNAKVVKVFNEKYVTTSKKNNSNTS